MQEVCVKCQFFSQFNFRHLRVMCQPSEFFHWFSIHSMPVMLRLYDGEMLGCRVFLHFLNLQKWHVDFVLTAKVEQFNNSVLKTGKVKIHINRNRNVVLLIQAFTTGRDTGFENTLCKVQDQYPKQQQVLVY